MAFETIVVETQGHVGTITLNRPESLNALNATLLGEMATALAKFDEDDAVGAIVLTGSDKAFAAGADIKEMAERTFPATLQDDFMGGPWEAIPTCRKPVIAAVAGYALGGGCELALACDIIIAADTARFGLPEITLGVIPGAGGTQRLTRAVGKAKAMEMILSGRFMTAEEAERASLVSRVVPEGDLIDEAMTLAAKIADMSGVAVMVAKKAVERAHESSLNEGLQYERMAFYSLFSTEDQKEGMAAFVEKRKAQFRDR
jgi:enoyl-CoA hydratase/carnithine racemase